MKPLKIDFVSDVACPWCAVGLNSLERALQRVGPDVQAELHFQPFELNPTMPAEGADIVQYISGKYGIGKVVMRRKEYLIALWCKENAILFSTLRYDHEVKGAELFDDLQGADRKNKEDIRKTAEIITHHTKKFRHKNFKDGYQDKLMAMIKQKVEHIQAAERAQATAEV